MAPALLRTDLPLPIRRGKVRDVYDLGDSLLLVATDRISAFDCIMPNGIPDKGVILTALSLFWFEMFQGRFPNQLLQGGAAPIPPEVRRFSAPLMGRSMLVKKTEVVPIECVARGYLAGSGWNEYQASQTICGVALPPGLKQCDRLPEPIFTPATKEESGHDINIDFAEMSRRIGDETAKTLRDRTLAIYTQAAAYAASRGILIADTKLEFGRLPDGTILLIDEMLTPDSSRFWPADTYEPGHDQPSFDKQFVRNWLESQPWDKKPPAPALPQDVVVGTRNRYLEAYEKLAGKPLKL